MCKPLYEGAKAEAFLSLFENDKTLQQIAKLVYVDGLKYSEVAAIVGYSERQIGRLCQKIKQIAGTKLSDRKETVEKITEILKSYTDKHGISASVVILQEYAEELVRNGVRIEESEGDIQLCNGQTITVTPDTICDFTKLPFEDNTYYLAVFDPPHLIGKKDTAWMVKKYGSLPSKNWQEVLQKGFSECMRVLKPNGVLIFKWNEVEKPLSEVLNLFGRQPLFGHPSGKRMNTHWVCFMKESDTE